MPKTDLELLPQCPQGHGQMVLRDPPGGHTPEQQWCGIWYDCPPGPFQCRSSVLYPSPELRAMYANAEGANLDVNRPSAERYAFAAQLAAAPILLAAGRTAAAADIRAEIVDEPTHENLRMMNAAFQLAAHVAENGADRG